MGERTTVAEVSRPVAPIHQVLGALQDPIRLEIVRRLANAGGPVRCVDLYDGISKSTATHHFNLLRDAGLMERHVVDGYVCQQLRMLEIEAALPGVLGSIVAQANREAGHDA
ncbi:ArsR/SmtB family transcription factor [Mycolicibacterium goodii]|uniref:ArsR family transcriptional regulator n=1 Tax=Mycolicibacterium goodii TaxID=134601 RepID=A0ABS6HNB5_MYCGD|nr:helix-turn-helix transcriptional regulator [Mycolicibacterium goodii]OKH71034.1 ArsR family transcriptional regulator [Mycobacterium sp. SWH-M5]MBU8808760.1 ArsR family transcriptional regulator [Mycolicibacterium goodii]MBU8817355.1 ArsR family transcriptional regulator [Mycolicibacterium goodii]MBU8824192.1 ArsR family transcriptional regulator [Mycolicibacterium goodii]MBU8831258.1 ArsR family transcriptional regulator [Mycolicibacterium goodii]